MQIQNDCDIDMLGKIFSVMKEHGIRELKVDGIEIVSFLPESFAPVPDNAPTPAVTVGKEPKRITDDEILMDPYVGLMND